MRLIIDWEKNSLIKEERGQQAFIPLYSKEAFELISELWVKVGWNEKYSYTFSWMGRPIIQLPEDMIRIQEVIYQLRPDVIVETGVAHGGSLVFYASLCQAMGKGKVIGVDITIFPYNRREIENHPLASLITLIEGDSTSGEVINEVNKHIDSGNVTLVLLDSNHTKGHVLKELALYSQMVSVGSYLVVTDGIMKNLYDTPRGHKSWKEDNPVNAVMEFLENNTNFILETPKWVFNESHLEKNITHWPLAWLKKIEE